MLLPRTLPDDTAMHGHKFEALTAAAVGYPQDFPAQVPERPKGAACKAVIRGFKSRPALHSSVGVSRNRWTAANSVSEGLPSGSLSI